MLSSITCDTPIDSLIKEDDVSGIISNLSGVIDTYINNINSSFSSEMTSGFSVKAYYANNEPTINKKALEVLDNIKIDTAFNTWKSDILDALDVQRKKELNKLKDKINEKIEDLDHDLNSVISRINSAGPTDNVSSLYSRKSDIEADLKKYKNKLRKVEAEI